MSWSIGKFVGHPEAVKPLVERSMDNAIKQVSGIAHECTEAKLAKDMIMNAIDFMIEGKNPAIEVEASGSASTTGSCYPATSQINIRVAPVFSFFAKE